MLEILPVVLAPIPGESHYRFHLGDQNNTPLLHELLIALDKDVDGTFPQLANRKRGNPWQFESRAHGVSVAIVLIHRLLSLYVDKLLLMSWHY